jgi:uncharacterized protein
MSDRDWRALHGGLLLLLLPLSSVVPGLAHWPWGLLLPLLLYALLVGLIPPLRRSVVWLKVGRLDPPVLLATAGIVLLTSAVLVLFNMVAQPDLANLREQLPAGNVLLVGALFVVLNASMEEAIFRGILLDALESQVPAWLALLAQAVVFGAAHYRGFPEGMVGVVLAAIYGLILGALRTWVKGLGAPVIAHICADATIYAIVVHGS